MRRLIGRKCKQCELFSLPVLIVRGLDCIVRYGLLLRYAVVFLTFLILDF